MKTVVMGNYWQSSNKEKEPIEWIVLREDGDKQYLLSKYCLDCVPYCDGHKIAWKHSLMRKWLNDEFLNAAFTAEEQENILLTNVQTQPGGWFGPALDVSQPVSDKIFLPSIAEAILFFDSTEWHDIDAEQKRIARPTYYACERGCWADCLEYVPPKYIYLSDNINPEALYWQTASKQQDIGEDTPQMRWSARWFLRSAGYDKIEVGHTGEISSLTAQFSEHTAVRPAMWVKR